MKRPWSFQVRRAGTEFWTRYLYRPGQISSPRSPRFATREAAQLAMIKYRLLCSENVEVKLVRYYKQEK